jgi:hypothetical protein
VNLQRINRYQVAIAGLVLAVGVALVFLFIFIEPLKKKINTAAQNAQAAEDIAKTRPTVEKQLADAQATEKAVNEKYQKILDTRMPKLDFVDPITSTLRMWDLGSEEQALMDKWFASTGAQVTGYAFPGWGTSMPSSFPSTTAKILDPLNWNLTVQVKNFQELMDWLLLLPKAPRFMVMGAVSIQGPHNPGQPLVASVPVTLYQWTGVEPEGVASPDAGAAAGPGAAGPGAGGGGGGMRGGGGRGGGMRGGGGRGGGMRGGGGRGMGGGGRGMRGGG